MKLFKSKEEKLAELEAELKSLNAEYADEINSYCKLKENIFIFLGFEIIDNEINYKYKSKNTLDGYVSYMPMPHKGYIDFKRARVDFLKFKRDLGLVGLKLEKI